MKINRWSAHRLAYRLGFLDLTEGDYYKNGQWRWDFWSVLAARHRQIGECIGRMQGREQARNGWYRLGRVRGVEAENRRINREFESYLKARRA